MNQSIDRSINQLINQGDLYSAKYIQHAKVLYMLIFHVYFYASPTLLAEYSYVLAVGVSNLLGYVMYCY